MLLRKALEAHSRIQPDFIFMMTNFSFPLDYQLSMLTIFLCQVIDDLLFIIRFQILNSSLNNYKSKDMCVLSNIVMYVKYEIA
jgi:hypothetical protein